MIRRNLISLSLFLIIIHPVFGEILFEDNFDSHPDWTLPQENLGGGTGASCESNCDVPSGWDAYYNGDSWCTGGPGHNNMYLDDINPRGGLGKSLTFWDEACTAQFEDSDGNLAKNLGGHYTDLFLRYFIKYSPTYKWDSGTENPVNTGYVPQHKLIHIWNYDDDGVGNPLWNFFDRANYLRQRPAFVPGWLVYNNQIRYNANGIRCDATRDCMGDPSIGTTNHLDFQEVIGDGIWGNTLGDDEWHSLEYHVKMNTYDNNAQTFLADGVHEFWIDGELIYSRYNIPWTDNDYDTNRERGFNFVSIGGNNRNIWTRLEQAPDSILWDFDIQGACSGTECEQWYAIDDVVISTEYIGPDYVIGDPPTPQCSDGFDNDGDGNIDLTDSGCSSGSDNDESDCGDGTCEGNETCSDCEEDCSICPPICINDADIEPCDGIIDNDEVLDYLDLWKNAQVSINDLINAIEAWQG